MVNLDNPKGLKPYGNILHIGHYKKDASAGAIAIGTVVKMEADGYIAPAAAGDTGLLGVALQYSAASTAATDIAVSDAPEQLYTVQDDAQVTLTQAAVGANADITTESVDTTLGLSSLELDASTISATNGQLRIMEVAPTLYPSGTVNDVGDNCDWLVKINEHYRLDAAGI